MTFSAKVITDMGCTTSRECDTSYMCYCFTGRSDLETNSRPYYIFVATANGIRVFPIRQSCGHNVFDSKASITRGYFIIPDCRFINKTIARRIPVTDNNSPVVRSNFKFKIAAILREKCDIDFCQITWACCGGDISSITSSTGITKIRTRKVHPGRVNHRQYIV